MKSQEWQVLHVRQKNFKNMKILHGSKNEIALVASTSCTTNEIGQFENT